jgi:hypothetical protein
VSSQGSRVQLERRRRNAASRWSAEARRGLGVPPLAVRASRACVRAPCARARVCPRARVRPRAPMGLLTGARLHPCGHPYAHWRANTWHPAPASPQGYSRAEKPREDSHVFHRSGARASSSSGQGHPDLDEPAERPRTHRQIWRWVALVAESPKQEKGVESLGGATGQPMALRRLYRGVESHF